MQTQLIISLVLIAIAATVALACDFLRARNAQLREELREHTQRQARNNGKSGPGNVARPERAARRSDRILATESAPPDQSRPPKANPVLTTWLIERAVQRTARKTGTDPSCPAPGIDLQVPPGMHPFAALSQLMENRQPFTGLVISIGVTAKNSRETRNEALGLPLEQFIAGLLRSSDFGCRVDSEEFVLLCPQPSAAAAQRHLSHISEQLWDYQLRGLGKSPLVFNMGGTDVHNESVADAISSARQRMNQSRRGATVASGSATALSLVSQLRKAV